MEPFIGQIVMFAGNFVPRGWAFCDGQLLLIQQNTALFSILGTMYGGDGETTFALPDLRGRFPMHPGHGPELTSRSLAQKAGVEGVALHVSEMPAHTHAQRGAEEDGHSGDPAGLVNATTPGNSYHATPDVNMGATSSAGNGLSHENMPPFLCVNFIIALVGTFPSS